MNSNSCSQKIDSSRENSRKPTHEPATVDSTQMTPLDEQARPEPPLAGDETATLLGALERQRSYLAWKCGGLDAAGLRATLAPSAITLGGLLKHLANVEDDYFSRRLLGRDPGPPWDAVDWDADPDWDWHSAAEDSPEHLMTLWQDAVAHSRGESPSLRRILIDLIEEYERHLG